MPTPGKRTDRHVSIDRRELSSLGRDELIRLVEDLREVIAEQEQTIARQEEAIAASEAGSARELSTEGAVEPSPGRDPATGRPRPAAERSRPIAAPAAEADYTIVFDGGAIGNPGKGYGSYQIVGAQGVVSEQRRDYGDGVTNNQAEYMTLTLALEDLAGRLGAEARSVSVAVRGDSHLVVEQVCGRWKVKHPDLQPLHRRATDLLRAFGRADVAWHGRDASVRILGH